MFSTADLCDKYKNKIEILNIPLKSYGKITKFSGEVVTLKLNRDNKALVEILKNENGRGKVAVVDVNQAFYAVVGDTLMGFAYKNDWAGIIINGYVRDTNITKNIEVGLLAIGTCPRKSFEKNSFQRDCLVEFGGVKFKSGDYVYADCDGVVLSHQKLLGEDIE